MKRKNEIIIPTLVDKQAFDNWQIVDLAKIIFDRLQQEIGQEILYATYKDWNKEFVCKEIQIKDLRIGKTEHGSEVSLEHKSLYIGSRDFVFFRNKNEAIKYCNEKNLSLLKETMEKAKESLDAFNPAKLMEKIEKEKEDLINTYVKAKEKYEEIKKSVEKNNGKEKRDN